MKVILAIFAMALLSTIFPVYAQGDVKKLENRRELFVDNYLIETMRDATLKLHHPERREIVMVHDKPWEGNVTTYHTIFKDGDIYRMYYNGAHFTFDGWEQTRAQHQEFTCYAESKDGIHWTRPDLGLVDYKGSKANNIIMDNKWTHCFAPFKDKNPACKPGEEYKAISFCHGITGLYAFKSSDAINWTLMQDGPVVTKGKFDSQNIAFWDTFRKRYIEFHRYSDKSTRAIMTSHSENFLNWTEPEGLKYVNSKPEHLYTNAIIAYERAPQIFMGFPMRFVDRHHPGNFIPGLSDGVFMTSRDGLTFNRWSEAFIRPGLNRNRWFNRCNMTAWGILETASDIPGAPKELSIYSSEGYSEAKEVCLRRYTLRLDGFVSVQAPMSGGQMLTKPFTFSTTPQNQLRTEPVKHDNIMRRDSRSLLNGKKSLWVPRPVILEIPGSQNLGKQVTLAVNTAYLSSRRRTLFSAYDGQKVSGDKRIMMFEVRQFPDDKSSFIRFWYSGGSKLEVPGKKLREMMAKGKKHHFALTWNDGITKIYIDGQEVASGGVKGLGDLRFDLGNLRFGEDYPPAHLLDNPFIGYADDILVLKRALSPAEVKQLAENGAETVVKTDSDSGMLYTMEGGDQYQLADRLTHDGAQNAVFAKPEGAWANTMLLLNVSTSAAGSVRCEIRDEQGKPVPGYTFKDCDLICGDKIEWPVTWNGSGELKQFAGKVIRLCFELKDADLYAMRFGQPEK